MRILTPILALGLFAPAAHAGGVGLLGASGMHSAPAYYYDAKGEQGVDWQNRPNYGFGGEALLGDKDDPIQGLFRGYLLVDSPLEEPDTSESEGTGPYVYPPEHERDPAKVGVLMVGLQWGLWGDPSGFQLTATTLIGSGVATIDNLEFAVAEPALGFTYTIADQFQLFASAAYTVRYRKRLTHGGNGYLGVRYMFD